MTRGVLDPCTRPPKRYSATDWAGLHGFSVNVCRHFLEDAPDFSAPEDATPREPGSISADRAWAIATRSLHHGFPCGEAEIERIATARHWVADTRAGQIRQPYTLPQGPGALPVISCPFEGRIMDLVTLTHEFSHAVQIAATATAFTPPVDREFCAFLGECALLNYARRYEPTLVPALTTALARREAYYARHLRVRLLDALAEPTSHYTYWWNYAPAFIGAATAFESLPAEELWAFFRHKARFGDWLMSR